MRTMARRADMTESAFVRRMIEVHAKLHEEIARAAENVEANAEARTLAAIAEAAGRIAA